MADWKKLCKQLILADGYIEEKETALIRAEILADGKVDDMEKEFLKDLKASAKTTVPEFDELVAKYT